MDESGTTSTDAPVTTTSEAPVDTTQAKQARLDAALSQSNPADAIHAALLEVIDACGTIRNGISAGETAFADAFAHARASLEAAFSRSQSQN